MKNILKDAQVNFKTNSRNLENAKSVFEKNGLTLTDAMNLFVDFVSTKNELPFQTPEEIEREKLIKEFQMQVEKNMNDIKNGKGISLDAARKRILG
jgi:addiction module RelB/DinJ family antitoxin